MKVAITSQGESLESMLDQRFGRCGWFVVADTEEGNWEAVSNEQNLSSAQGAGIQSAETVCRCGAEAVITGHVGPKAFKVLNAAGIKVYCCTGGTVAEALEKFKKGELKETLEANVEGHWI
ncbi:MAG: NifB/NifX family molybdenum-iron cluster-binding protein [Pelotomaculum sp.]|uniref:Uncharacterized conserved protein n=1 Tax=Pelotomaculum thermopropionicum (strain DSM 13744 / JCM 10971 / SI) TaxID=370438 RepID=A5D4Q4_PELTS|nr:NifB/NifX family molybdenum-iron cluster-binding protein [Pelotomaculum sp.]BAF58763.1 uncharacterized conserved protein [Pelotomaculum thermopropionicum SI]